MAKFLTKNERISAGQMPISAALSVPAPTKGWNARDELDAMDPLDAVQLDNWLPDAGGLFVRGGSSSYATGMGSNPVETLAAYNSGGTVKFIAASGGSIYDVSNTGAVGAALASGLNNNRWQTVSFLGRVFLVNGVDHGKVYNGSTIANDTWTGVATSTLVGVWQFQQRLFFWANNSTGFWYAPLNSITGALSFYDLSPFCPRGGNLTAMTSVSYDGGNGVLDYAVFIMSSGDMMVFQGNDPSLASSWSMVGQYRMSPPVSPRAVADYGGDSFITTYDDHCTIQQMFTSLRAGQLPPRSKVSKAVQSAVTANKSAFGWQAIYYPRGRVLIFNIPNIDGTFSQHVCNTGLPAQPWCRYIGLNASCWALYNDLLYFGGPNGTVYLADTGNMDSGSPIVATAQQSWNKFGTALRKRVTGARPVVQSLGGISYSFAFGFDYSALDILTPGLTPSTGTPWDTLPWDTSKWSSDATVDTTWHTGGGTGAAVSFGIKVNATQLIAWYRTDVRTEGGNAL